MWKKLLKKYEKYNNPIRALIADLFFKLILAMFIIPIILLIISVLYNLHNDDTAYEAYEKNTFNRAISKIQSGQPLSPDEKRVYENFKKWEQQEYDKQQRQKFGLK